MKKRIYICHTFYHVYIACLKELKLNIMPSPEATILLSTMSNDFGDIKERLGSSGLFEAVFEYDERPESFFPELKKYHTDRGKLLFNMINRIIFTKKLGKAQIPFLPIDFRNYENIYVFCDSDPIGYYLNYAKIYYHALEDGLNCLEHYDTARFDNRGNFRLKAWMSAKNLIFIQNGYGKYCLDMEVNDISVLKYPCAKYIEMPREELVKDLDERAKGILLEIFVADIETLKAKLDLSVAKVLILSEPLCDLETRKRIFSDIIDQYGQLDKKTAIIIKPHPRDEIDYMKIFPRHIVLDGMFPMEILNYIPNLSFDRVVSVFTVPDAIKFAKEIIFLGKDFMDKYEDPLIHRQNEQIN